MDLLKILDTKPAPGIVDAKTLGVVGNTSGDYWLPTTMCLYQKELTDQIVSLHYSDILRYFETKDYKEDVVLQSMETMCLNSQYVATHPYLLIDHYMPKSLLTKDVPLHLAESSGKFAALRDLVNMIQDYETDVALSCRPGRTMDLVEALLLGNKVNIKRYDGLSIKSKQKPKNHSATCHLFPSQNWNRKKHPIKTNAIFTIFIAIDPSVDTDTPEIQSVLTYNRPSTGQDSKAPIVRMSTINSIDHCKLYFGKLYKNDAKGELDCVTAAVVVLRDRVGILPPDLRPIYAQKLLYLLDWIEDPALPWPLPEVYPIKKYTSMDVERSLLTEVHYNQFEDKIEEAFAHKRKRGRVPGDHALFESKQTESFYNIKRLKNDYSTNPLKQDMTHLTGITTSDVKTKSDYHLSSDTLTHKLVQAISQKYINLERQAAELKDYNSVEPIQLQHWTELTAKWKEIKEENNVCNSRSNEMLRELSQLESANKLSLGEIEVLEENLNKNMQKLGASNPELKQLFMEVVAFEDELSREERILKSRLSEKKYMEEEISRAKKAIADEETEISRLNTEIEAANANLKKSFEQFREKTDVVAEKVKKLKEEKKSELVKRDQLNEKFEKLTKALTNMPTSRIRMPSKSNESTSKRRYKSRA